MFSAARNQAKNHVMVDIFLFNTVIANNVTTSRVLYPPQET